MRRLGVVGIALLGACSSSPASRGHAEPVVFVLPGYGGDEASVAGLVDALTAAGRDVRVVVPPEGGRARMTAGAEALDVATRGLDRVDVVGFSAGGIVVRTWLALNGGAARARHVVTLAAPHHGSAALRSVPDCTAGCVDLLPESALLRQIAGTPAGPDYVAFWTADDTAVTPPTSAMLEGARNIRVQDVCTGRHVAHLDLVTDPKVLAMTVAAAASGAAATFTC